MPPGYPLVGSPNPMAWGQPRDGYPDPNGHRGQRSPSDFAEPNGSRGRAGFAGVPGRNPYGDGAGYAGRGDFPAAGGYESPEPNGYDRVVNRGEYANLIREEASPGLGSPSSGPGRRARDDGRRRPDRPAAGNRAITAGQAAAAAAAAAYGPDDPGYGPPGPDWYRQDLEEPERPQADSAPVAPVAPVEARFIRSPFEPLSRSGPGSGYGGTGEAADTFLAPASEEHESHEISAYRSNSYESLAVTDLGFGEPEEDPLSQLRNLYASADRLEAATIGADGADRQLDQLLERQRKLISEYFKESGGLDGKAAGTGEGDR